MLSHSDTQNNLSNAPSFPFQEPCSCGEALNGLYLSHNATGFLSDYELGKLGDGDLICLCMTDMLLFHPSMLAEVMNYPVPHDKVRAYLSRLKKRGMIKSTRIPYGSDIHTVYYLTKAGYMQASSRISNCCPFKSKAGQRLRETALHDYGVSCGYLAFVRAPFSVAITYEASKMFPKASMPSGRYLRNSLRPDAMMEIHSTKTSGRVFIEHDTGTEQASRMIDKLNLYYSHGLLDHSLSGNGRSDCVIFTFRKNGLAHPECFNRKSVKALCEAMPDGISISQFSDPSLPPSLFSDLRRWTPAYQEQWGKAELKEYLFLISNYTEPSLIRFYKLSQRNSSAFRRNAALRILFSEYRNGRSSLFYPALMEMMRGYPVGFVAYNCVDRLLPFLFSKDYPQFVEWLISVLTPYYGSVRYAGQQEMFKSSTRVGEYICMSHIFVSGTGEKVAVEYVSGDISAAVRMNALLNNMFDLSHMPFKCVFVVDSYQDADALLKLSNPFFRRGETTLSHGEGYGFSFLALGTDHLFSISPDGCEVRILA